MDTHSISSVERPAILVEDLAKKYPGGAQALDGLSFSVGSGEIFGFLGPNGAGKTTAIRIMCGQTAPSSGRVEIDGLCIVKRHVQAKLRLGVLSQDMNLDPDLSAAENLLIHGLIFNMDMADIRRRMSEMLDFVGLTDRRDAAVRTFSGGMKRRLQIARAMMHEPAILMLDEPTVGLDAHARREIWAAIRRANSWGTTIFLTTHYIEEAEAMCGRVAVIDSGRIISSGTPASLVAEAGVFSVDVLENERMETRMFPSREDALRFIETQNSCLTIRHTSLEDFFLQATGRRIGR